ncbi:MAG: fucose-binding protein [Gammaproteobacteria bacterium]|nr:fucose-binding protein [Gammaproteobacteria bacterium]MDD9800130.1 fucose-binding protein [Gammaproteobacteria bacterium]MDD9815452.1 fucose-binding protein [Gammaproteobacteria bacterium]MDD9850790.1 fucose-binding protein [Gammaproteobacteria bacterium]MDD9870995.1 fucose-binding protein [Gammaproteobacteria bacterium]
MLKNIHPVLIPELLSVMAQMGHGDELALVDANFPTAAVGAETVHRFPVHLAGVDIVDAVRAVLTVFPLDDFVEQPVRRMEVVGDAVQIPPAQREVVQLVGESRVASLERFAFYAAARRAFAVVRAAGETRPYGCFLLRKGVINPHPE